MSPNDEVALVVVLLVAILVAISIRWPHAEPASDTGADVPDDTEALAPIRTAVRVPRRGRT